MKHRLTEEIQNLIKIIRDLYDVQDDYYTIATRTEELVEPRQVLMYFLHVRYRWTYKAIGLLCGGRDHSTAIHAKHAVQDQIDVNKAYRAKIEQISEYIFAYEDARFKALLGDEPVSTFCRKYSGIEAAMFMV